MEARHATGGGFVAPDSVLALTAGEIVMAHGAAGEPGRSMEWCGRCYVPMPCPPARSAMLVLQAAGLPVPRPGAAGGPEPRAGEAPTDPPVDGLSIPSPGAADETAVFAAQPAIPHVPSMPVRSADTAARIGAEVAPAVPSAR